MRPILAALALLIATPVFAQDAQTAPGAAQTAPQPAADAAQPPVPQAVTTLANPEMTGPRILIATSMGDITVQLDSVHAPKTVANILRYVKEKHYDGTSVYRVAHGFVIQMGSWDANGKGRGIHAGPVAFEGDNGLHNLRGTVALARGEALDSGAAEFFISLSDDNAPRLDRRPEDPTSGYAVFGQVISGLDVVDAIGQVPTGDGGPMPGQTPVTPIIIRKISLLK